MINLETEEPLTLAQATRYVPKRRGKKVHSTTLWRWAKFGHRGIHLEALRTPSGWVTTAQAVQRFLAALAKRESDQVKQFAEHMERQEAASRQHEEAVKSLRARGVKW